MNCKSLIIFFIILFIAAFFRFYGVNWDQNQHLHPDERFLTMVTGAISWPHSAGEYLNTNTSPLNPQNRNFGFFVYGTFPIFFTKIIAEELNSADYNGITLTGRKLSALFDLGTVILVFFIAKQIVSSIAKDKTQKIHNTKYLIHNTLFPHLAMFLYSIFLLPIQLSHFYAVETYLTFFITLSFYFLLLIIHFPSHSLNTIYYILNSILLGISFGFSIASKISAVVFLPIICLGFLYVLIKRKNISLFIVYCSLFIISSYLTVRLAQPYLFSGQKIISLTLNPKILDNWKQLQNYMKPDSGFPPSVQWIGIKPVLFPLASLVLWGTGIPLGITALLAICYLIYYLILNIKKKLFTKNALYIWLLILLWITIVFTYQNLQPGPNIRYFHYMYPFIALITSFFIHRFIKFDIFILVALVLFVLWPVAYLSIYSRPHSRVAASKWIYDNIPSLSTIGTETWDDGLPLTIDADRINQHYQYVELPLYDADNEEKYRRLSE